MASTRAQQGTLITQAASNGFLNQVVGSLVAMAISVIEEASTVADHANRLKFANAIVANPTYQATFMLPGYLQSANISAAAGTPASIADADVDAQTINIFNFYANQYAAQIVTGAALNLGS